MRTFGFPHPGPLAPGDYLLGSPRWSTATRLLQARLTCVCGSTTPTVLALEVGGALSGKTLTLQPAYAGEVIQNGVFQINYLLPAETAIRWRVLSAPAAPADRITRLGLTLSVAEAGTSLQPAASLHVMWRNEAEYFRLYDYAPATHTFTETTAGLTAGRATLANATDFSAVIQSTLAAQADGSGAFSVNLVYCNGGSTALESGPRLEFFSGPRRLGSLTKAGTWYVPDLFEEAAVAGGSDRFEFYGGGSRVAALGGPGVQFRAQLVEEPV